MSCVRRRSGVLPAVPWAGLLRGIYAVRAVKVLGALQRAHVQRARPQGTRPEAVCMCDLHAACSVLLADVMVKRVKNCPSHGALAIPACVATLVGAACCAWLQHRVKAQLVVGLTVTLGHMCARSAVYHPGGLLVGILHSIPCHHRRLLQPAPSAGSGQVLSLAFAACLLPRAVILKVLAACHFRHAVLLWKAA